MSHWTGNEAGYSINEEVQLMWDKISHYSGSHREGDCGEGGSCPPRPDKRATSISLVIVWTLDVLCGWINSTVHVKGKEGKGAKTKTAQEKSPMLKGTSHYLFIYPPQKTAHLPCALGEGQVHALSLLLIQITALGWETWTKPPQVYSWNCQSKGWGAAKKKCWELTKLCREEQGGGRGSSSISSLLNCLWGGHSSSCSWYSSPNYGQGLPLPSYCSSTFNFPGTVPARLTFGRWEKPLFYFDT